MQTPNYLQFDDRGYDVVIYIVMSRKVRADSALHSHHVLWCALNEGQRSRSGQQGQTICSLQYQELSSSKSDHLFASFN